MAFGAATMVGGEGEEGERGEEEGKAEEGTEEADPGGGESVCCTAHAIGSAASGRGPPVLGNVSAMANVPGSTCAERPRVPGRAPPQWTRRGYRWSKDQEVLPEERGGALGRRGGPDVLGRAECAKCARIAARRSVREISCGLEFAHSANSGAEI